MTKNLVIVESPAKSKTIEKFLGRSYTVRASMGHLRDLPKSIFGVDIENGFEPKYINIRGKGELIKELKAAAKKADKVYIATDFISQLTLTARARQSAGIWPIFWGWTRKANAALSSTKLRRAR